MNDLILYTIRVRNCQGKLDGSKTKIVIGKLRAGHRFATRRVANSSAAPRAASTEESLTVQDCQRGKS